MARLYADENFPFSVVVELRRLGHDVLTIQDSGYGGLALSDENVLDQAIDEKRALLTLNRKHFIALHRAHPDHSGIVVCSFDPDFLAQADRIHRAIEAYAEDLDGQLLRINRSQS